MKSTKNGTVHNEEREPLEYQAPPDHFTHYDGEIMNLVDTQIKKLQRLNLTLTKIENLVASLSLSTLTDDIRFVQFVGRLKDILSTKEQDGSTKPD